MQLSDFDYELPEELIAQHPPAERDASRMLIVDRAKQDWQDSEFASLPEQLRADDVLVVNNTRVFPARLVGERVPTGGAVKLLLLREIEPKMWSALTRPARRLRNGTRIKFGDSKLEAEVIESLDDGVRMIRFESDQPLEQVIDEIGQTPLPPYIKRRMGAFDEDSERYQTVYASERGAIAAPTAGLHFTPRVFEEIASRGVRVVEITLHVGYGTFEPVRVDDVSRHRVAPEWFSITDDAAQAINRARAAGGRVIAVGTTTTRALDSSSSSDGRINAGSGFTELTIVPGYEFRVVNALVTNFHLPRSSLLMLVSAFAGRELILAAYRHAVGKGYRFYSYGDSMLIT
ncbi:MAG TPA: tRNA preQ1(34) S-adenosylmethionine ribosyltransferase-isomerase QueA [Pyrinomonadaceae bacterium]|nr:tRNA preQ1(34) S-adenosylmethionine ribosyltransferase-isomerase QueA [Pyrinomonadaceae bacterium]